VQFIAWKDRPLVQTVHKHGLYSLSCALLMVVPQSHTNLAHHAFTAAAACTCQHSARP